MFYTAHYINGNDIGSIGFILGDNYETVADFVEEFENDHGYQVTRVTNDDTCNEETW